jgi:predicted nucleic acid-binding protein
VYTEPESEAVSRLLAGTTVLSSMIAAVEVSLTARKGLGEPGAKRAAAVMADVTLLELRWDIADVAATLTRLRTLDAIHLATALSVAHDLDGFVSYDARLTEAASSAGLDVLSPV